MGVHPRRSGHLGGYVPNYLCHLHQHHHHTKMDTRHSFRQLYAISVEHSLCIRTWCFHDSHFAPLGPTEMTQALYRVFPRPLAVHKSRLGDEDRWICDFKPLCSTEGYLNWCSPRVNQISGSACALVLTYAIYSGYKSVMPVSFAMGVLAYILRSNPICATAKLRNSLFMGTIPYVSQ